MAVPISEYWRLLSGYLAPQKHRVLLVGFLMLGAIGLQIATPQLIAAFIDDALGAASQSRLLILATGFIVAALAGQALAVASTYVSETIGWTATNSLRSDLAAHCLGLDQSFHKTRTPGEMIQRLDGDVDALSNFFSQLVIHVIGNVVLITGVLAVLFVQDWRIGLGLSAFALTAIALLLWLRSFAVPAWLAVREEQA